MRGITIARAQGNAERRVVARPRGGVRAGEPVSVLDRTTPVALLVPVPDAVRVVRAAAAPYAYRNCSRLRRAIHCRIWTRSIAKRGSVPGLVGSAASHPGALAVARERLDAVLFGIDLLELSTQIKQRAMDPSRYKCARSTRYISQLPSRWHVGDGHADLAFPLVAQCRQLTAELTAVPALQYCLAGVPVGARGATRSACPLFVVFAFPIAQLSLDTLQLGSEFSLRAGARTNARFWWAFLLFRTVDRSSSCVAVGFGDV